MLPRLRLIVVALAVTALGPGFIGLGGGARASTQPALDVGLGQTASKSYPPIPGQFPGGVTGDVTLYPDDCAATGTAAVCDTVPINLVNLDLDPAETYLLKLEVSWNDDEGLNDIDVYLYDDRQVETEAGDSNPYYTELNNSATSDNPEKMNQFGSAIRKLNLVVVNFSGPNLGYTVKATLVKNTFEKPFELLAPEFSPSGPSGGGDGFSSSPFDYSATPAPSPSGSGPSAPTFGELAVEPDTSLDFGPSDFEQAIAAPPAIRTGAQATRRPPRPVPGAVAAFWLGAVPLALVAALAVWVARRRRDNFALA